MISKTNDYDLDQIKFIGKDMTFTDAADRSASVYQFAPEVFFANNWKVQVKHKSSKKYILVYIANYWLFYIRWIVKGF